LFSASIMRALWVQANAATVCLAVFARRLYSSSDVLRHSEKTVSELLS
jgi:hypothetical protein